MAGLLPLDPDQLLTTTRAVRKRLDLTRPVPREVLMECLEVALQAPSGSNRQAWQWVFVDDHDLKQKLAGIYGKAWDVYSNEPAPELAPGDARAGRRDAVRSSAQHLRDHLHEVPVLMVPCLRRRAGRSDAGYWGSILPAVWSFCLALRARGLGSAWTSLTLMHEAEVAALLGIEHDRWAQAGLFPIAYTKGTDFKPASRIPAAEVVHWNGW